MKRPINKRQRPFAARLGSAECVIARRVGEQDTLYGSVTAADIAESLAALNRLIVDKRKIQLGEPIRELGEFFHSGEEYTAK